MSSEIQFYKSKIFSEEFTKSVSGDAVQLSKEDIFRALKSLFEGKEKVAQEYRGELFEEVKLEGLLTLSDKDLEKIDPRWSNEDELYYLFDPKTQTFSFVDKKLWQNLEKIILSKISKAVPNNHENKEDSSKTSETLDGISDICQDYRNLKKLFEEKNLFIAIF